LNRAKITLNQRKSAKARGETMPLYDCGDRDCDECQRAFGPSRDKAIRNFEAREVAYAALERKPVKLNLSDEWCLAAADREAQYSQPFSGDDHEQ